MLEISKKLKISKNLVRKYLKQGFELGWCDYNAKEVSKYNLILMMEKKCIKVICVTTGEIFKSGAEAGRYYNISCSPISKCCKGKIQSAGKHPETGKKMVWMYYEDYINEGGI